MQYTKQAKDFYCQLDILKERGLTIEDEEDAIKFLHSVSYFRFANYLQPMELNTESIDLHKIAVSLLLLIYMSSTVNFVL